MGFRLCSLDSDETQEHLQLCEGTKFERRGLDLSDWRGLLDFWRRMKIRKATSYRPVDVDLLEVLIICISVNHADD